MPLTPKQQRFVEEYLIDLNATRAAKVAGYSKKTAEQQGSGLLRNIKVQAEIQRLNAKRQQATGITPERVIAELGRIAFVNPQDFFDTDGNPRPIHTLDPAVAAVLAGFETEEETITTGDQVRTVTRTKKVKLWNKNESLVTLAKHFQLLTDRVRLESEVKVVAPPPLNLTGMNADELSQLVRLLERAVPAAGSVPGAIAPGG